MVTHYYPFRKFHRFTLAWNCIGATTDISWDSIFMVMNRFSKMTHIIPYGKTANAMNIAYIFYKEIICLHGAHTSIVSNQNMKLIGYI